MLMDSIFGPLAFKSEIIWPRTGSHNIDPSAAYAGKTSKASTGQQETLFEV